MRIQPRIQSPRCRHGDQYHGPNNTRYVSSTASRRRPHHHRHCHHQRDRSVYPSPSRPAFSHAIHTVVGPLIRDTLPATGNDHKHHRSLRDPNKRMLCYSSLSPVAAAATAAVSAATEPVSSAVATTASMASGDVSFWRFLLIFTAGGLFFSTALAIAVAFYTMGVENMKRFTQIGLLVLSKIWNSFLYALALARRTLIGIEENIGVDDVVEDGKTQQQSMKVDQKADGAMSATEPSSTDNQPEKKPWKWRDAWAVLKEQLSETKRTAQEGVQALRQEATLYAAAVGQPGLLPIQYAIQKLMPYSIATILEDTLKESLRDIEPTKTIRKMKLSHFTAGNKSPILGGARLYDIDNTIACDLDVNWESELEAEITIFTVGGFKLLPVLIRKLKFIGVVRVILTPLTKQPPGYGAMLVSLPSPPDLSLDVKVLGAELTKFRFLKTEITQMMQKAVSDNLLWPKRNVIPVEIEGAKRGGPFGNDKTLGPMLNRQQLLELQETDPFLVIEQELAESDQALVRDVNEKRKQLNNPNDRGMMILVNDDVDDSNIVNGTGSSDVATRSNASQSIAVDAKVERGTKDNHQWWHRIRDLAKIGA